MAIMYLHKIISVPSISQYKVFLDRLHNVTADIDIDAELGELAELASFLFPDAIFSPDRSTVTVTSVDMHKLSTLEDVGADETIATFKYLLSRFVYTAITTIIENNKFLKDYISVRLLHPLSLDQSASIKNTTLGNNEILLTDNVCLYFFDVNVLHSPEIADNIKQLQTIAKDIAQYYQGLENINTNSILSKKRHDIRHEINIIEKSVEDIEFFLTDNGTIAPNLQEDFQSIRNALLASTNIINTMPGIGSTLEEAQTTEVEQYVYDYVMPCLRGLLRGTNIQTPTEPQVNIPKNTLFYVTRSLLCGVVFANIIKNAINSIQLADRTGQITLSVDLVNEHIQFKITDNGLGLTPKKLHELNSGKIESSHYSGLGVKTARSLLRRIKGSLRYTSTFAHGTTAIVSLPTVAKLMDKSQVLAHTAPLNTEEISYYDFFNSAFFHCLSEFSVTVNSNNDEKFSCPIDLPLTSRKTTNLCDYINKLCHQLPKHNLFYFNTEGYQGIALRQGEKLNIRIGHINTTDPEIYNTPILIERKNIIYETLLTENIVDDASITLFEKQWKDYPVEKIIAEPISQTFKKIEEELLSLHLPTESSMGPYQLHEENKDTLRIKFAKKYLQKMPRETMVYLFLNNELIFTEEKIIIEKKEACFIPLFNNKKRQQYLTIIPHILLDTGEPGEIKQNPNNIVSVSGLLQQKGSAVTMRLEKNHIFIHLEETQFKLLDTADYLECTFKQSTRERNSISLLLPVNLGTMDHGSHSILIPATIGKENKRFYEHINWALQHANESSNYVFCFRPVRLPKELKPLEQKLVRP